MHLHQHHYIVLSQRCMTRFFNTTRYSSAMDARNVSLFSLRSFSSASRRILRPPRITPQVPPLVGPLARTLFGSLLVLTSLLQVQMMSMISYPLLCHCQEMHYALPLELVHIVISSPIDLFWSFMDVIKFQFLQGTRSRLLTFHHSLLFFQIALLDPSGEGDLESAPCPWDQI